MQEFSIEEGAERSLIKLEKLIKRPKKISKSISSYHAGVDLGTSTVVFVIIDGQGSPVAGASLKAEVVREGVIFDFVKSVEVVKQLKKKVEKSTGIKVTAAGCAFPPAVPLPDRKAFYYVLERAGLAVPNVIDEVSAANTLLQVKNGAIVDIGDGSTGIGVFSDGKLVYVADEPTGGRHLTLVISGRHKVPYEEAERMKQDTARQEELFSVVEPVMEKVALIIKNHINAHGISQVILVGGSSCFPGFDRVVSQVVDLPVFIPPKPLLVTPLGIALSCLKCDEGVDIEYDK